LLVCVFEVRETNVFSFRSEQKENGMKTKMVFLAVSFGVLIAKPIWAQQQNVDPNLMVQLEQRRAESDSEARRLTGAPKEVWLLRRLEIEKTINQLKAGQSVDPKEIDRILQGQVNY
jgi:hypothetical protein